MRGILSHFYIIVSLRIPPMHWIIATSQQVINANLSLFGQSLIMVLRQFSQADLDFILCFGGKCILRKTRFCYKLWWCIKIVSELMVPDRSDGYLKSKKARTKQKASMRYQSKILRRLSQWMRNLQELYSKKARNFLRT